MRNKLRNLVKNNPASADKEKPGFYEVIFQLVTANTYTAVVVATSRCEAAEKVQEHFHVKNKNIFAVTAMENDFYIVD